jgi:hypothetical protein
MAQHSFNDVLRAAAAAQAIAQNAAAIAVALLERAVGPKHEVLFS